MAPGYIPHPAGSPIARLHARLLCRAHQHSRARITTDDYCYRAVSARPPFLVKASIEPCWSSLGTTTRILHHQPVCFVESGPEALMSSPYTASTVRPLRKPTVSGPCMHLSSSPRLSCTLRLTFRPCHKSLEPCQPPYLLLSRSSDT